MTRGALTSVYDNAFLVGDRIPGCRWRRGMRSAGKGGKRAWEQWTGGESVTAARWRHTGLPVPAPVMVTVK